jgi:hypothetical protein
MEYKRKLKEYLETVQSSKYMQRLSLKEDERFREGYQKGLKKVSCLILRASGEGFEWNGVRTVSYLCRSACQELQLFLLQIFLKRTDERS